MTCSGIFGRCIVVATEWGRNTSLGPRFDQLDGHAFSPNFRKFSAVLCMLALMLSFDATEYLARHACVLVHSFRKMQKKALI